MVEIHFNSDSIAWSKDMTSNRFFVLHQIEYMREKLLNNGYLYLNDVYEAFGVKWTPDNENVCFRKEDEFKPIFEMHEDEIIIKIEGERHVN